MGSEDKILDWAYNKVSDWSSKDSVSSQIDSWASSNAYDKGERWNTYKSKRPDWFTRESDSGTNLFEPVTDVNRERVFNEVKQSTREDDVKAIDLSELYTDEAKEEAEGLVESKLGEITAEDFIEEPEEDFSYIEDLIRQLNSANTVDRINELIEQTPGTTALRKRNKELADRLSDAIANAAERKLDLQTTEE